MPNPDDAGFAATRHDFRGGFTVAFATFVTGTFDLSPTESLPAFVAWAFCKLAKPHAFSDRHAWENHGQCNNQQRDASDDGECD